MASLLSLSRPRLERLFRHSQLHHLVFGARAPERAPIYLVQRRVYVLPTLHGVTFGMALALMLIGSVNYGLSLGFLLTFLLAGVALVGMVHTYRNLLHLYVSPGRSEPVFAGDKCAFVLLVENRARYDRFSLYGKRAEQSESTDVPAGAIATLAIPATTERRGWLALGRVTLETRYPLGLFTAWSHVQPDLKVLVYAKPEWTDLPRERPMPEEGGSVESGFGSEDFAGLRPYQPSDSPRHVAWKISARDDSLLTKQWSGRGVAELWLDWDLLEAGLDVEARLSRMTAWVIMAEQANQAYGLRLPAVEIPPGLGPVHRERCLRELALY